MKYHYSVIVVLLAFLVIAACDQDEKTNSLEDDPFRPTEPILTEVVLNRGSMADALAAYVDGRLVPPDLLITYSDLHPLHGGLEIGIDGLGHVQQKALREEMKDHKDLSQEEMVALVKLIIGLESWKQIEAERTPLPDESRATLQIEAGDSESRVWEWYNDMVGNNRLIQIREMMKQFAWE